MQMRIKSVFSYQPSNRLVVHTVEQRHPTEIVVLGGLSGLIVRVAELDAGKYYYTTPRLAIEAFIGKAEAALARPCDAQNRKAWHQALATARHDLSSQIAPRRDV